MGIEQYVGVGYKLKDSDNFDEFMKALGVGMVQRKLAGSVSPTVTLTEENGVYTLSTASTIKNSSISFKLGEEFEEETMDGRKVKTTVTVDGDKMTQRQVDPKINKETVIVREYTPTSMTTTMTFDGVVCKRTYTAA